VYSNRQERGIHLDRNIQKSLKELLAMEALADNEPLFLEMSGASGSEKDIADAWVLAMYRHGVFLPECFRGRIIGIIRKNSGKAA